MVVSSPKIRTVVTGLRARITLPDCGLGWGLRRDQQGWICRLSAREGYRLIRWLHELEELKGFPGGYTVNQMG